ncbi:NAD(P)/FAD-dependent oxidoreductase [Piscinibacter sakaiensis]|uniref:NAD(P)/FAD-dependent oxidoreductase n=1 Tax=Piscinibacter sakaiensis TaxID=1547922 RepID=UPI003AAFAD64
MAAAEPIRTDAVVIGAGPVGLFQVFQLGLQEIHVELIDALPHLGGQCAELYPDKPIYDIPGLPVCGGRELAERLERQMAPMRPGIHLGQIVERLAARDDGRFDVETSSGQCFDASCVVIAGGIGAFEPKRLKIDGLAAFEGRQLFHSVPDAQLLAGRQVVIVGGEQEAVDTALALTAEPGDAAPASVTLVHRRDVLKADPAQIAEVERRIGDGRLRFVAGQPTGFTADGDRLRALELMAPDASSTELPLDVVLVRQGLSPHLGPIARWGLQIERKQLVVDTAGFETSVAGIHAVGDVNTYPGKKKLIVCGFHEATLAAFAAAARLFPDRPAHLQYTTTSPRLHRLLGVGG